MVQTLDNAKIATLETQLRQTARNFMRRLAELEKLTGVTRDANIARFIVEATQPEKQNKPDQRLQAAFERGTDVREKLKSAEGGSYSADEAADAIGMSKAGILKRYKAGRLVAWQEERQNAVRFPKWQFINGKVLAGLEEVLGELDPGMDDYGRLLFFFSTFSYLSGERPLDCLRKGQVHKVVQVAKAYGR